MCCQTNPTRKALLDALRIADPKLTLTDETFWHAGKAHETVDAATVQSTLDELWLTVMTSEQFDRLPYAERLRAQQAWLDARTDALDNPEVFGAGSIGALQAYENRLIKAEQRRERGRTVKRVVTGSVIGGLLMTIGVMAGSTQPHDADAASLYTRPAATQSVVYSAPVKGRCDADAVKVRINKAKTVTWEWRNGNIGQKKVKAGRKVCRVVTTAQPGKTAQTYIAPTNAEGVVTALPKAFPSNPTTADIAALGWDYTTPVEPTVKVPRPSTPSAPARTADSLSVGKVLSATPRPNGGYDLEVEYTITGGSGVITFADSAPVKLNPSGAVTFVAKTPMPAVGSPYTMTFRGTLEPDYGQADLPATATAGWRAQSNPAVAANAHTNYSTSQAGSFAQAYDPVTNTVIVYN